MLAYLLLPLLALAGGNERIQTFHEAKKHLPKIHAEEPYTIYCHCRFKNKKVDLESCGYKPRRKNARAYRLEWEHVVPAEAFGQSFPEWRQGAKGCKKRGRKCAGTNREFARMEADMYNLWPEIGELNGLRKNYTMAALGGSSRNVARASFGGCQAVVTGKKFEPMDPAKGIVARVYMYMDQAYPGRGIISEKNRALFEAWDKSFPVTAWECKRAEKIRVIQRNENPVLKPRCEGLLAGK